MAFKPVSPSIRKNAKRLRKDMTPAEKRLWNQIRAHRLSGLGFRRQYPVGDYIADFACPTHKLILEIDGSQHGLPSQLKRDAMRTAKLGGTGWIVIRFWNDEVLRELDDVCNHIVTLVQEIDT